MIIQRLKYQSLFDIAIQYCGSIEAVFDIARLNAIDVTNDRQTELLIPYVYNRNMVEYYSNNNIVPATAELSTARKFSNHFNIKFT
jgi:hypothetical protein